MGALQSGRRQRLIAAVVLAACTVGRAATAGTSFIPIPEIITDPNEGNTFGLLGVVLFTNPQDEIQYLLAPDAQYNSTKGFFPTFRFFGYPTPTRRYSVVLGKSTTRDEDYELAYSDRGLWDGRAFLLASAIFEQDSTERFFGFGNNSSESRESNYTSNNVHAQASPGMFVLPNLHLSYKMDIQRFHIKTGQVTSLPFIFQEFSPKNPRLSQGVYWTHHVALTYDSRDAMDITSRGTLGIIYGEIADRNIGSLTSFRKYGIEVRQFVPLLKENPILALRALADYTTGDPETPFWQENHLGGRRTLRGFGSDRFIDFNRSLATAELRTRVYQRHLFGVNAALEVAPFVEAGQVFHDVSQSPLNDLHWVYGVGFRGVVKPQIVGFVDIGRGDEGTAIFTGVDYPF